MRVINVGCVLSFLRMADERVPWRVVLTVTPRTYDFVIHIDGLFYQEGRSRADFSYDQALLDVGRRVGEILNGRLGGDGGLEMYLENGVEAPKLAVPA